MSGRLRLVQVVHLADIGMVRIDRQRVRVDWCPAAWAEYRVRATGPAGQVAETYFTNNRADALGIADAMLADLAAAAGMPA
jgi:hypothetical protein